MMQSDEKHDETNEKPCRACMDFRSWIKIQKKTTQNKQKENNGGLQATGAFQKFNIPSEDDYGGRGRWRKTAANSQTITKVESQAADNEDIPLWGSAAMHGCPADSVSLGRGSWRLLHTMAAYYPVKPSTTHQTDMKNFLVLFSKFYPCKPCAEDFRDWLKENPPEVGGGKKSLSKWMCEAHNDVNRKLGKPEFDCSLVDQRWGEGWKDGSCD